MASKYDSSASRGLTLQQRFMAKVFYIPESGCWYWGGHLDRDGYAKIHVKDRPAMAHAVAYRLFVGPVPEGKILDHTCRNRECVNPAHQEPVTSRENTMRSPIAPAAVNARMTHCKRGHEFAYRSCPSKSQRYCPTCRKSLRKQDVRKVG